VKNTMAIYRIYLHPDAMNERWDYLRPYFHPRTLNKAKKPMLLCVSLENSFHIFLKVEARNFECNDNEKIHIPYNLVDAMFEIPPEEIGKIGYDLTKQDAPFPDPGYRST